MNSLSWFLYFADVLPKVMIPFIVIPVPLFIGFMLYGAATRGDSRHGDEEWQHGFNMQKLALQVFVPIFCVAVILSCLIPSRETFYLIAGSELGEQVVKTPEAREIFDDIRTVIKQQIHSVTDK